MKFALAILFLLAVAIWLGGWFTPWDEAPVDRPAFGTTSEQAAPATPLPLPDVDPNAPPSAEQREQVVRTVRDFYAAVQDDDTEALRQLVAPSISGRALDQLQFEVSDDGQLTDVQDVTIEDPRATARVALTGRAGSSTERSLSLQRYGDGWRVLGFATQ